jgi:subtilisin family serine protease
VAAVLALAATAVAAAPTDPLADAQWYLAANRTFDAWVDPPALAPVRVAIVDSGIDRTNPEFKGRIAAARSFVGGTPDDEQGHGTIVAGIIAANARDGIGVAGSSPSAKLLVAKVVTNDGTVPIEAEARAIRWATDAGARVVNVSLGGLRDPSDPDRDTFSPPEREAVEYAVSRGVLVVAAVGNGDQAPTEPWRFASYPAATPHVLGVGALTRRGTVPGFSNRDPVYVDLVAPGEDVVSAFPLALTARSVDCAEQGSTLCAPGDYRDPEGTSFAAPQVTAAAALLFALQPSLRAEQVRTILERSAVDVTPREGCGSCAQGRDALSGFGRLDVTAAVAALAALPPADVLEPNDEAGVRARRLWGPRPTVRATVDVWDDPDDVYAVRLARGERVVATVAGADVTRARLVLWGPDTTSVTDDAALARRLAAAPGGTTARVEWRATQSGWHLLHVRAVAPGPPVAYTLKAVRGG